jgi:DNA-binding PadR family transcriptional regulator
MIFLFHDHLSGAEGIFLSAVLAARLCLSAKSLKKRLDEYSTQRNTTLRTMKNDSQLGFALLGLMHQQPMSGYDLRKIFTSTAMGSFSDSPGAIYPALKRLEAGGLARGTVEESASLRKRRVFTITAKGLAALKGWLNQPVTQDDVVRGSDDLMLRFAFMDRTVGEERTLQFLGEFAQQIAAYLPGLQQFLDAHASEMPLSGRLALECGIQEYAMQLQWARKAVALYEQRKGKQG